MIEEIGDISKKIHAKIKTTEDPLPSHNEK